MATRALMVEILSSCRAEGAFHPKTQTPALGVTREAVDAALDRLRLGGFVEIADWHAEKGQGYRLTAAGEAALSDPGMLDRPAPAPPPPPMHDDDRPSRAEETVDAIRNPATPWVTRGLIALNVAVFVVALVYAVQNGATLEAGLRGAVPTVGALSQESVFVRQEHYRIFTYGFLHSGAIHLALNMIALLTLGTVLESRWGSVRFAGFYLGCMTLAALGPLLASARPTIYTVGASGAISGALVGLGLWAWVRRDHLAPEIVSGHLRATGTNLMLLAFCSFMPGVSWQAHLAGAIAGGLMFFPIEWLGPASTRRQRASSLGALATLTVTAVAIVAVHGETRFGPARRIWQVHEGDVKARLIYGEIGVTLIRDGAPPGPGERERMRHGLFQAAADDRALAERLVGLRSTFGAAAEAAALTATSRANWFDTLRGLLDDPDAWPEARRDAHDRAWPGFVVEKLLSTVQ